VSDAVLHGYSAFSKSDAERAAARLLDHGPARIKLARGIGGRGQFVIQHSAELDKLLAEIDDAEMASSGVVLEEQLDDVTTYRVGGASAAEVEALLAFRDDPSLNTVRAATVEVYGASPSLPSNAVVFYAGVDERVGPVTHYVLVERHGDVR